MIRTLLVAAAFTASGSSNTCECPSQTGWSFYSMKINLVSVLSPERAGYERKAQLCFNRAVCARVSNVVIFCLLLVAAMSSLAGPLDVWQWRNPSPTGNTLSGITYGNGVFMAVGHAGAIITSADGTNWVSRGSATTNALRSVAYGNGAFIAVGTNGVIATSPDGASWTTRISGTAASCKPHREGSTGHSWWLAMVALSLLRLMASLGPPAVRAQRQTSSAFPTSMDLSMQRETLGPF